MGDLIDMRKRWENNYRYVSTFVDKIKWRRSPELLLSKDKDGVLRDFKHSKNYLEDQASTKVKKLTSDSGKEYNNDVMKEYLSKSRIIRCVTK